MLRSSKLRLPHQLVFPTSYLYSHFSSSAFYFWCTFVDTQLSAAFFLRPIVYNMLPALLYSYKAFYLIVTPPCTFINLTAPGRGTGNTLFSTSTFCTPSGPINIGAPHDGGVEFVSLLFRIIQFF